MKNISLSLFLPLLLIFLSQHSAAQQNYEFLNNDTICSGDSYYWHSNNYDVSGTYYDSLTSISGTNSVYILNLLVRETYTYNLIAHICENDSFLWQGNYYNSSGIYQNNYTSIHGCDSIYIFYLTVYKLPSIDLGNDSTIFIGQSIILDAGNHHEYNWSNGGISQYEEIQATNGIPSTLNISVNVTDHGCSNSDEISITFISMTNIENSNTEGAFNIFPNPSDGIFNIKTEAYYEYKIYDFNSRILYKTKAHGNTCINLSNESKGIYFLEIEINGKTQIIKLINK